MINAEKIALAIAEGAKNIVIHEVPTTSLWLVCEKKEDQNWKMTICNPFGTKHHCIATDVTRENYLNLWVELVKLKASSMSKNKDPTSYMQM